MTCPLFWVVIAWFREGVSLCVIAQLWCKSRKFSFVYRCCKNSSCKEIIGSYTVSRIAYFAATAAMMVDIILLDGELFIAIRSVYFHRALVPLEKISIYTFFQRSSDWGLMWNSLNQFQQFRWSSKGWLVRALKSIVVVRSTCCQDPIVRFGVEVYWLFLFQGQNEIANWPLCGLYFLEMAGHSVIKEHEYNRIFVGFYRINFECILKDILMWKTKRRSSFN